ncbi:hypothetical protein R1flu_023549 [Riccia fluitans]|uniref:Response regulatory domain-containing protein n=1 Tax=Riccia fluitans TaxID=41844 RepID=A0ABD1XSB4_9MARC
MAQVSSAVGRRIMLIDSDDSYLRLLYGMLMQCGYRITACRKMGKALSVLRERTGEYDLILCSAHMPDVEDFKLVYTIRFKWKIPVILMSYDEEPNSTLNGMIARESCGYLRKPVDMDMLRNIWSCDYLQSWRFKKRALTGRQSKVRKPGSTVRGPEGNTSNDVGGGQREQEIPVQGKERKGTKKWTAELQGLFEEAVGKLGMEKATAESILLNMGVQGVSFHQIAKKWKLYRQQMKHTNGDAEEAVFGGGGKRQQESPVQGNERKSITNWTAELQSLFEEAVGKLGVEKATAETILRTMGVDGISYNQVARKWRMYRQQMTHTRGDAEEPVSVGGGERELEIQVHCSKSKGKRKWTAELQSSFEEAVGKLGIDEANAESILQTMAVEGVSSHQIRKKWRLYRKQMKHTREEAESDCTVANDEPYHQRPDGKASRGERLKRKGGPLEGEELKFRKRSPWTSELYQTFEKAVREMGGIDKAKARPIFEKMSVVHEDLTFHSVNYHLGLHRKK